MLQFTNVCKSFNNRCIINNLSYNFNQEKYCITGANGVGKTTFLLLASGIEQPDLGSISFLNKPVSSSKTKKYIGISSDKINLPQFLTANEIIQFHCNQFNCAFPDNITDGLGLTSYLATKIGDLSLGTLKKLTLALALAHKPLTLLLDEPTTGLDEETKHWLIHYLSSYLGQQIITSHDSLFTKNKTYIQLPMSQLNEVIA